MYYNMYKDMKYKYYNMYKDMKCMYFFTAVQHVACICVMVIHLTME